MTGIYQLLARLGDAIPYAFIALVARIAAAVPFWRSGQTKLAGGDIFGVKWNVLNVGEKQTFLFENVFNIPAPLAPAAAHAAAIAEFFFPIMLVLGLFTRFGALGLLAMTAFIQFYVFPAELFQMNGNWSLHLLWAAPLLLVFARGPGAISLDAALGGKR